MAELKITMPDNLKEALLKETYRLDIKVSTFISNLLMQELGDKIDTEETENDTPIDRRVCKVKLIGPDADYIQRRSKELNITPKQFIGKLIHEQNSKVVNIDFLDEFMEDFRTIENNIRKICFYASRDESHQISEDLMRDVLSRLNEVIDLFCHIYKELIKTKQSIVKKANKER